MAVTQALPLEGKGRFWRLLCVYISGTIYGFLSGKQGINKAFICRSARGGRQDAHAYSKGVTPALGQNKGLWLQAKRIGPRKAAFTREGRRKPVFFIGGAFFLRPRQTFRR